MPAADKPTIQQQVEQQLSARAQSGIGLPHLYELLPELSNVQIRSALKSLTGTGRVIMDGSKRHPVYRSIAGPELQGSARIGQLQIKPAEETVDAVAQQVHWPDSLQVLRLPTPERWRTAFTGVDWSNSIARPGCQDAFQKPSRRGDEWFAYRGPLGVQAGRWRP
jgi:hypothetical protein